LPEVLRYFGRQYPAVRVELEIGIGTTLFKMLETGELDLVVGGRCDGQTQVADCVRSPWCGLFRADAEVPKVLPLAFFPEPCPYREAGLRALAGNPRRWHIACTSSSLAGVRAACMAGLAVTPLPKHAIKPGLRVLGKTDNLPILPEVEYVSQTNETDTRQIIATLDMLMQEKALL
jgi:DNA-binding transcriptional LysR family regulator